MAQTVGLADVSIDPKAERRESAYLPVLPSVRDRANEYLQGMAYRGFGCTVEEAVRMATLAELEKAKPAALPRDDVLG